MASVAAAAAISSTADESGAVQLKPSLRLLSAVIKLSNAAIRRNDHTIRRWLASIEEFRAPAISIPISGVSTKDVRCPSSVGDSCWARIFVPVDPDQPDKADKIKNNKADKRRRPVIVYYHGGGFVVLRPDFLLYDVFCRRLAKATQCIVVSVHYLLAPEHPFPAAHESSYRFLRWLASAAGGAAVPPDADLSRCFLAGDSAGGNIVHFTACRAANPGERSALEPLRVMGTVLLQPFFGSVERTRSEISLRNGPIIDLEMTDWYWRTYLPAGEDRDHPMCNVFGPRSGGITGVEIPPCLVLVGEYDLLRDAQVKFAEEMAAAGKDVKMLVYKRGVHCFQIFYRLRSSAQCLSDIAKFVQEKMA